MGTGNTWATGDYSLFKVDLECAFRNRRYESIQTLNM